MFQDAVRGALTPIVEDSFAKVDAAAACGITGTMAINAWVREMGSDGGACRPIPTNDIDIKCDTRSNATDPREARRERAQKARHASALFKHIRQGVLDALEAAEPQEGSAVSEAREGLAKAMGAHGMEVAWSTDQPNFGKQVRLSYAGGGLHGQWEVLDVGGGNSEHWQLARGTLLHYEDPAKVKSELCKLYDQGYKLEKKQAKLQYWNLVFRGTDLFQRRGVGECD